MIIPRLKSSTAWTDLPDDFKTQVITLFNKHFIEPSKLGHFEVSGRIYKKEIIIRFIYLVKNQIKPMQFDLSTDYESRGETRALTIFEKLIDCAASLFHSSFEDESFGVPAIWTDIDFDGIMIYAKSESINQKLEDEANQLLGKEFIEEELELKFDEEGQLINGDLESDDIEVIAETLNKKKTPTH